MPSSSATTVALQGAFNLSIGVAILLFRSIAINSCEVLGVNSIPSIHTIGLLDINFGALLLNVACRKDRPAVWMLGIGRLLAILVFLADGGPRVNLAAFDGACGVLTPMALGWEAHGARKSVQGAATKELWRVVIWDGERGVYRES